MWTLDEGRTVSGLTKGTNAPSTSTTKPHGRCACDSIARVKREEPIENKNGKAGCSYEVPKNDSTSNSHTASADSPEQCCRYSSDKRPGPG